MFAFAVSPLTASDRRIYCVYIGANGELSILLFVLAEAETDEAYILNQNELKIQLCWSVIESTLLFLLYVIIIIIIVGLIERHLFECESGKFRIRKCSNLHTHTHTHYIRCPTSRRARYIHIRGTPRENNTNMWIICLDSIITEW